MTVEQRFDEPRDQFPVGMRVLAVDDDPTCLLLLETLLRRCQYHVTTTNQAVKALDMLRENKNMFDLVISDVHMPDMDGFKLLEHVGLEMDLPVIMLSTNGDHKLLMKGITHGACDYLLKPIRIEELKNIWQHVIRRKKFDSKDQNNSDKPHHGTGEGGHDSTGMGNSDQNGKLNKNRKDQNEDEDDERDENGLDNDDPSTQKKPQVVWSVELHRKFVAAVNQLGIDKAVPKRILELMNVDKLTRENVASHLQKYRLYLKRISCVATHNMVAAFGSTDPSYLRMGPLNGLGNFHTMAGSGQFQSAGFRSFPHSGMVGRLNTPAGLGIRGLPSPGMVQLGHAQHVSYPINDRGKFQPGLLPGNQGGSILQGMPMSLELDHLQNNRSVTNIGELSTTIDDSTLFPVSSGLPDTKITIGSSSDSLLGVPNNLFMLQGHPQETQSRGGFGNQSSVTVASLSSEVSSPLPDLGRCNDNWPSAVQSSGIQSNSLPINDCFEQATLYTRSLRDNMSSMVPDIGSHSHDVSSIASAPTRLQDSRIDLQCQAAPISSNSARNMNCTSQQIWENHKQDISHHPNLMCNSINSSIVAHGVVGPLGQSLEPKRTISPRNMDFNLIGQSNFVDPLSIQRNEVKRSAMESSVKLKQGYLMGQGKAQGSYTSNNFGSLEDLVSAMMKQGEPSCLEGCTSMGPWGGPGGSKFSFCVKGGIKQMVIAHGVAIDSIIFKGDNGDGVLEESNKFGSNGGSKTTIHIAWPKEYLTSISGSYESFYSGDLVIVTSLCFITNHTKYGPFGIHQGTSFSSTPMEGSGIIGFHGRAGQYFDAIGVYAKPMSECQKIEKGQPHSLEKLYILLLLLLVLVLMHKCSYYYQY